MKIYKSKRDWWLMLIVYSAVGIPIVMGIIDKVYWMIAMFIVLLIAISMLFRYTVYKIDGETLIVWTTKIDVHTIRKIYKTNNPLSSPALSLDRIAVCYNKYDEVLISPKQGEDFIKELLKVNPDIEVKV